MEKKYQYNIYPQLPLENDLFPSTYQPPRSSFSRDFARITSHTTPLNRQFDQGQKSTTQNRSKYYKSNEKKHNEMHHQSKEENYQFERKIRTNSTTGLKRKQDESLNYYQCEELPKQAKKVHIGVEQPYLEKYETNFSNNAERSASKYQPAKVDYAKRAKDKRFLKDESVREKENIRQNVNYSNSKHNNSTKGKREQQEYKYQLSLNQKEVMQKVNRINRLNEEINSRLQRMLSKVSCDQTH